MRSVEVRRHSITKKGEERGRGSNLSQEGVDLARRVGAGMSSFDLVVGSRATRTIETALVFGLAVEDELSYPDVSDGTGIDFGSWWDWPEPFEELARIIETSESAARAGHSIVDLWEGVGRSVHSGGRALIVSHGGVMELGLVAALRDADRKAWGALFEPCEGFALTFDADRFVDVEFLRLGD